MNTQTTQQQIPINTILYGNCIEKMRELPANSVDFIFTDPPYLVNYRDRSGRSIQNDVNDDWLRPAMREAYRVLKHDRLAIMFYSWTRVDAFFAAWKNAGFHPVGHIVFRKTYSSKTRFLSYQHEQAYLLAKGRPSLPVQPIADVIDMPYTGNKLHPTQNPCRLSPRWFAASLCQENLFSIPSRAAAAHVRPQNSAVASILASNLTGHILNRRFAA